MKVYIAGPMTGRPGHNFPAFEAAAAGLRDEGWEVVSPAELTLQRFGTLEAAAAVPWEQHLRHDVKALMDCDLVTSLPGANESRGASLELALARQLGIRRVDLDHLLYPGVSFRDDPRDESIKALIGALGRPNGGVDLARVGDERAAKAIGQMETLVTTGILASGSVTDRFGEAAFPMPRDLVGDGSTTATTATTGVKADDGKSRVDLIPTEPLIGIGDVFAFGAAKYSERNWERGLAWSRVYGALQRHLLRWWGGEDADQETGRSHLDHAGCDLLMLSEYEKKGTGDDDRP